MPKASVLVTRGVYSKIPHPLYAFLDVALLGAVIALRRRVRRPGRRSGMPYQIRYRRSLLPGVLRCRTGVCSRHPTRFPALAEAAAMFMRAVFVVTLVAFSLSSASCAAVLRTQPPARAPDTLLQGDGAAQLKAIVLRSGERIEFSKSVGARFTRDRIVAVGLAETVPVAEADLETAVPPGATSMAHAMARNGVEYTGTIAARENGTITLRAFAVVIPMSGVDRVDAKPTGAAGSDSEAGVQARGSMAGLLLALLPIGALLFV